MFPNLDRIWSDNSLLNDQYTANLLDKVIQDPQEELQYDSDLVPVDEKELRNPELEGLRKIDGDVKNKGISLFFKKVFYTIKLISPWRGQVITAWDKVEQIKVQETKEKVTELVEKNNLLKKLNEDLLIINKQLKQEHELDASIKKSEDLRNNCVKCLNLIENYIKDNSGFDELKSELLNIGIVWNQDQDIVSYKNLLHTNIQALDIEITDLKKQKVDMHAVSEVNLQKRLSLRQKAIEVRTEANRMLNRFHIAFKFVEIDDNDVAAPNLEAARAAAAMMERPGQKEGVVLFGSVSSRLVSDYLMPMLRQNPQLASLKELAPVLFSAETERQILDIIGSRAPGVYQQLIVQDGSQQTIPESKRLIMKKVLVGMGDFFSDYAKSKAKLEKISKENQGFEQLDLNDKKAIIQQAALNDPQLAEVMNKPMNPLSLLKDNNEDLMNQEAEYIKELSKNICQVLINNLPQDMHGLAEAAIKSVLPEIIQKSISASLKPALFTRIIARFAENIPRDIVVNTSLSEGIKSAIVAINISKNGYKPEFQMLVTELEKLNSIEPDKSIRAFNEEKVRVMESFIVRLEGTKQELLSNKNGEDESIVVKIRYDVVLKDLEHMIEVAHLNLDRPNEEQDLDKLRSVITRGANLIGSDSKLDPKISEELGENIAILVKDLGGFVGLGEGGAAAVAYCMNFFKQEIGEGIQQGMLNSMVSNDLRVSLKLAQQFLWDNDKDPAMQDFFSMSPEAVKELQQRLKRDLPRQVSDLVVNIASKKIVLGPLEGSLRGYVEPVVRNVLELLEDEHALKILTLGYVAKDIPLEALVPNEAIAAAFAFGAAPEVAAEAIPDQQVIAAAIPAGVGPEAAAIDLPVQDDEVQNLPAVEKVAIQLQKPGQKKGVVLFTDVSAKLIHDYVIPLLKQEPTLAPLLKTFPNLFSDELEQEILKIVSAKAPGFYQGIVYNKKPESLSEQQKMYTQEMLGGLNGFFKDYVESRNVLNNLSKKESFQLLDGTVLKNKFADLSLDQKLEVIQAEAKRNGKLELLLQKAMNPLVLLQGNDENLALDEVKWVKELSDKIYPLILKQIPEDTRPTAERMLESVLPKLIQRSINAALKPDLFIRIFERVADKIPSELPAEKSKFGKKIDEAIKKMVIAKDAETENYQKIITRMQTLNTMEPSAQGFKKEVVENLKTFKDVFASLQENLDPLNKEDQIKAKKMAVLVKSADELIEIYSVEGKKKKDKHLGALKKFFVKEPELESLREFFVGATDLLGEESRVDESFNKVLGHDVVGLIKNFSLFAGFGPEKTGAATWVADQFAGKIGNGIQEGVLNFLSSDDLMSALTGAEFLLWDEDNQPAMQDLFSKQGDIEQRRDALKRDMAVKLAQLAENEARSSSGALAAAVVPTKAIKSAIESSLGNFLELMENEHALKRLMLGYLVPIIPIGEQVAAVDVPEDAAAVS